VRAIIQINFLLLPAKLEKFTRIQEFILIDEIWSLSFSMTHLSNANLGGLDNHRIVGASKEKQEINLCVRYHLPPSHLPRFRASSGPPASYRQAGIFAVDDEEGRRKGQLTDQHAQRDESLIPFSNFIMPRLQRARLTSRGTEVRRERDALPARPYARHCTCTGIRGGKGRMPSHSPALPSPLRRAVMHSSRACAFPPSPPAAG